eukprot:TRINITY_DN2668_c0_g1_i1.p2 TRINITY_DN2668_c0_g1~~TRINITY_DN2668_c0_g1_i1.p2  ORF type:complete len:313 (-),score=73.14 TRINITY_DN2668_c0_g1_i1:364-1302(-)
MESRLTSHLESISAYSTQPYGHMRNKAGLIADNLHHATKQAQAMEVRSKGLSSTLDSLYDENDLLRRELQHTRQQLAAALRSKEETEKNLAAQAAVAAADRQSVDILQKDKLTLDQNNSKLQRDNEAFHSENVDVRVRVVELDERTRELETALAKAEREREEVKQALSVTVDNYNQLHSQLEFAVSEYSLKTSPVRVAAGDGRVDLLSSYLRRVAEDHPTAMTHPALPASVPAHPRGRPPSQAHGNRRSPAAGGCRYLEARAIENTFTAGMSGPRIVPSSYVGFSASLYQSQGAGPHGAARAGQYVPSPYRR